MWHFCTLIVSALLWNLGASLCPRLDPVKVKNFGYTGLSGPLNWYGLDEKNALCSTGKNQSPIEINETTPGVWRAPGSSIILSIPSQVAHFENVGKTVQVKHINGIMGVDGKNYTIQKIHFISTR